MAIHLRSQVSDFVILFVERAGSTFLVSLLNSHPDIECLREQFAVIKEKGQTAQEQLDWAEEFWSHSLISKTAAFGFKTKTMDIMDPEGFAKLMREKQCKVIQLQRRNIVKGAISTINAKRLHDVTGTWNLLDEKDRRSAFEVDFEQLDEMLEEREAWDAELTAYAISLNLPTIQLFYEDLLQDRDAFLAQVFEFLGVEPKPVEGKTYKNTKDDLREVVLNYDALKAHYDGTKYAVMFEEVLV